MHFSAYYNMFFFQNATDISSDEKEIDEEDSNDSEDDDQKFVVPDGYLSQEEKLDEDKNEDQSSESDEKQNSKSSLEVKPEDIEDIEKVETNNYVDISVIQPGENSKKSIEE